MAEPVTPLTPAELAVLERILGQAPGGAQLLDGLPVAEAPDPRVTPITTRPPLVRFLTTAIPPPAPFYLAAEDILQVELWSSLGNLVTLGARLLRPDGVIIANTRDFTPTSNRVRTVFTLSLGEGYLLGLHFGTAVASQPGQTFVLCTVVRPQFPLGSNLATLVSGYVTTTQRPGWPITPPLDPRAGPGNLREITGNAPAFGAEILEAVPSNARWNLLGVRFVFTAGATAASRQVSLRLSTNGQIHTSVVIPQIFTANQSAIISGGQGGYSAVQAPPLSDYCGLPVNLRLRGGSGFWGTVTGSLQADDQYTAPVYLVEEWIDA